MEPQAIPQPPTPPISPNPPAPQIKNSLVLILSVLLIITVGIAGLFYFQIQKLSKELSKYQIQPSPSPATTTDPTANWKIYNDEKNGIEFKYPNTWFAMPYANSTFSVFLENHPFEIPLNSEFFTTIQLGFNEATNTQTNKRFFFETTLADGVERIKSGYDKGSLKVVDNLLIGGRKASQLSGILAPGPLGEVYSKTTLIQLDGKLLFIGLWGKEFESIYDQILSTFIFIEATPSASPIATPTSLQ